MIYSSPSENRPIALGPLHSLLRKSQKALQKLEPGTWQHTWLTKNIRALLLSSNMLKHEPHDPMDVSILEIQESLGTLSTMIDKVEQTMGKFKPGSSQHTLQKNRLNALRLAESALHDYLRLQEDAARPR